MNVSLASGDENTVTIPAGAVIEVKSGPRNGSQLLEVVWEGRSLLMFLVDLDGVGVECGQQ